MNGRRRHRPRRIRRIPTPVDRLPRRGSAGADLSTSSSERRLRPRSLRARSRFESLPTSFDQSRFDESWPLGARCARIGSSVLRVPRAALRRLTSRPGSRRWIRAVTEARRAAALDAIAAVAVPVDVAGERGAAVTRLVGRIGAAGVLLARPSRVARYQLAAVGVGAPAGRVATIMRRHAGVPFRARDRLARAVRLAARLGAARVGDLRARWRRVLARPRFAARAATNAADARAARLAVVGGRALERWTVQGRQRTRDGLGPARAARTAHDRRGRGALGRRTASAWAGL